MKKKYFILLLSFISSLGYCQADVNGARKITLTQPDAIEIEGTPMVTNVTGNGLNNGGVSVIFKGGKGSFSYVWTKNKLTIEPEDWNMLGAGEYTITANDINCSSQPYLFNIFEPAGLKITIDQPTKILCFGGYGNLTAQAKGGYPYGGTANYTYNWFKCDNINGDNPIPVRGTGAQLNNVKAGFYMVTVIDNQNTTIAKDIEELMQNLQIQVLETVTPVSCRGGSTGSIKLTPSGGAPGTTYSISWSDNDAIKTFERTGLTEGTYRYTITDDLVLGCSTATIPVIVKEPALDLDVTYTSKQPTLTNNNGEIKLNATGGILPSGNNTYTYQWSKVGDPTFVSTNVSQRTDLGNGIYNIKVTSSSGCPLLDIPITLEALYIKNTTQQNIKCYGAETGSLFVQVSGGTNDLTGYKYKWFKNGIEISGQTSDTITGIAAGSYRVEVSDDLNTIDEVYTITTEPLAPLTATATATDVICYGENSGTITLNIQGGIMPYTVAYINVNTSQAVNSTQLPAGTYSYIITDNNKCTFSSPQNIKINQNNAIVISGIRQKQPTLFSANDGEITINANGGTGKYSYIIKKNNVVTQYTLSTITGLGEGIYEVSVIDDNKCTTVIETITLKALTLNLVNKVNVSCYGANTGSIEVHASGGTPIIPNQYTYKWYYKQKVTDTYSLLTSQVTYKAENLYFGFYKVIATDNVGVTRELEIAELTERPAITYSYIKTNVSCFNGNDGSIALDIKGGTGTYVVVWKDINDNNIIIDPTQLSAGEYIFSITDSNGCYYQEISSIKITEPLKPLVISNYSKIESSGFGLQNGSIEIVASEGTSPYTYQWYKGVGKTIIAGKKNPLLNGIGAGTYTVVVTDKNLCTTEATYTILQPNELLINTIVQTETVKCFDNKQGILKATITGGAPIGTSDANKNYIYKWYNSLTPAVIASTTNPSERLLAGTYLLEVSDGFGNSYTSNPVTIIQPDLLKINYTQTNVSCNGQADGDITIAISGGTGPYTIVWSTGTYTNQNTLPSLLATTYNVTVTDSNLCVATQEVIITEPQAMGIIVTKTPPSTLGIDDASIEVTVTGGTPNYNFKWYDHDKKLIYTDDNQKTNSIYNIYVGQYFITITDANGCKIVERDLDQIDPLLLNLAQINIVKCQGDATASIKAITSGGLPGYYYKWYDEANPGVIISEAETLINVKAGIYYAIVTDSFGKSIQSDNITITEAIPLKNVFSSEYTRCGDGNDWTITSTTSGGTTPYTYLWSTGAKTANLIDVIPGNYSLLITDKNGCMVSNNTTIVAPIHLATSEIVKIPTCYGGSDASIELTSSGGQTPYTYLWDTGEKTAILNSIAAGSHKVTVTDSKNCVITKEIIVNDPPKEVINIGEDMTLCIGQSVTINASVDDNLATYSWTSDQGFISDKPIVTISKAATYSLVVTNKLGCQAFDSIKIDYQDSAIESVFAVSSQVFVNESFVMVDISNPKADSIEWLLPAEATVTVNDTEYAEMSFSKPGEYTITLITRLGNCTASQTKKVLVVEGEYINPDSSDLQKKFDMKIYPNPSNGIFTVDVTLDKIMSANVKIYNLVNNVIIDSKFDDGKDAYEFNFNLNGLAAGIYFVLFESQQGSKLRKIIIQ